MTDETLLWRAQTYALLATLLAAPPQQQLLDDLANIEVTEPDSPMGQQWLKLITAAKTAETAAINSEFQTLFIGVTHGELIPYGSFYQTGFLMEEPLAELRTDLAKLGLARQDEVSEPEDHAAAQCDVMRLILMAEGTPVVTAQQFFQQHLAPWMSRFFDDMANAESADFYQIIASFASQFILLEKSVFR